MVAILPENTYGRLIKMSKFIAAVVQMNSQQDKRQNLADAKKFLEDAVAQGAKFVIFPEGMDYCGLDAKANAEEIPGGEAYQLLAGLAAKHHIWVHSGSVHERNESDDRPYNTSFVINPKGELAAVYRKIHLFDVDVIDGPSIKESDRVCPGNEIVTVDTGEIGHLGLSICYDMRFGELYRLMTLRGANILCVPACFNLVTGKDHWEPILRTRAIENGCYVIAPGQIGVKPSMPTYGKSMIIDPWGNVIARASDRPCVITAEIDLDYVESVRKQTYTLDNRRTDRYELTAL